MKLFIVCEKCRPLVLLASQLNSAFLAFFMQETALLSMKFSGMPVAAGFFGWRWLVNFSAA